MKKDINLVHEQLKDAARMMEQLTESHAEMICQAADIFISTIKNGGKILLCGNGGSAADCQHMAAELVGRYQQNRRGLTAVSLTTDTSVLTAVANDLGFERVFMRQVEALGAEGDVLVAITTSGSSPNVLLALEEAKRKNIKTVAIVGEKTESVSPLSDVVISIPSVDTPRIQEAHQVIEHILCDLVERACLDKK